MDLANRRYVRLLRDDILEDDDPHKYEDLHTFDWDTTFDVGQMADGIEGKNYELWTHLKVAICCKLGISYTPLGWQGIYIIRILYPYFMAQCGCGTTSSEHMGGNLPSYALATGHVTQAQSSKNYSDQNDLQTILLGECGPQFLAIVWPR